MLLASPLALSALARVLVMLGACVLLVWMMTRGTVGRTALRKVLDRPGLLVPAAMTTAALLLFFLIAQRPAHENPLAPPGWWSSAPSFAGSWIVLAIVAAGLAGQIGLLEADARGVRPNAGALLHGIRRHFLTIALAKIVVAGGAVLVASFAPRTESGLIFFLIPSLLVAPVLGMASRHPGHAVNSLTDALRFSSKNIFAVGWPVLCQAAILIGLVVVAHGVRGVNPSPELLAFSASSVSFNHFPLGAVATQHWVGAVTAAVGVFASAVFVTAHWLGVKQGYRAARTEPRGAGH